MEASATTNSTTARKNSYCNSSSVYLPSFVVDHNIVRLDVSMHDALAVTVFQRLQIISTRCNDCSGTYFDVSSVIIIQLTTSHVTDLHHQHSPIYQSQQLHLIIISTLQWLPLQLGSITANTRSTKTPSSSSYGDDLH